MKNSSNDSSLAIICHPYFFAFKAGKKILDNPFDFSLLLIQRKCNEIVKAPKRIKKKA